MQPDADAKRAIRQGCVSLAGIRVGDLVWLDLFGLTVCISMPYPKPKSRGYYQDFLQLDEGVLLVDIDEFVGADILVVRMEDAVG